MKHESHPSVVRLRGLPESDGRIALGRGNVQVCAAAMVYGFRIVEVWRATRRRTLGESPRNMVYLLYSQRFMPSLTVVARTSLDPERTALSLLAAGRELDPDLRVLETKTMDRHSR